MTTPSNQLDCALRRGGSTARASAWLLPMLMACAGQAARAGEVAPGDVQVVKGGSRPPESWSVDQRGSLWLQDGASTLDLRVWGEVLADRAHISSRRIALLLNDDAYAQLQSSEVISAAAQAIRTASRAGVPRYVHSRLSVTSTLVSGADAGVYLGDGGSITIEASHVEGRDASSAGAAVLYGSLSAGQKTLIEGAAHGVVLHGSAASAAVLDVKNSEVLSSTDAALLAAPSALGKGRAIVRLGDRARLASASGHAIRVEAGSSLDLQASQSAIVGDVDVRPGSSASMVLKDRSTFTGSASGPLRLHLASGSRWALTGRSSMQDMMLDGGHVDMAHGNDGPRSLHLSGDLGGTGGVTHMRAWVDAPGAPVRSSDTLLIDGDVSAPSRVLLDVNLRVDAVGGRGAEADGDALVHVKGASSPESFALAGGYLALGPYQYRLLASRPPGGNTCSGGSDRLCNVSYRLSRVELENPDDGDGGPTDPMPGAGSGGSDDGRPAVVPQLASYLSVPSAVALADAALHDAMLHGGMRRRLGDVASDARDGEAGMDVFARTLRSEGSYRSNVAFKRYGYAYRQRFNAAQVGAGLVAYDAGNGSLRAGWSLDRGSLVLDPRSVDGRSASRLRFRGGSAWVTWTSDGGAWVDWLVSHRTRRGSVSTDERGAEAGSVRIRTRTLALEAGAPLYTGLRWLAEGRVAMAYSTQQIQVTNDADAMHVRVRGGEGVSGSAGVTVLRWANPRFAPYASLRVTSSNLASGRLEVRDVAGAVTHFKPGSTGTQATASAGLDSLLTRRVRVYGDIQYQHQIGTAGFQGWSANAGVRVTF